MLSFREFSGLGENTTKWVSLKLVLTDGCATSWQYLPALALAFDDEGDHILSHSQRVFLNRRIRHWLRWSLNWCNEKNNLCKTPMIKDQIWRYLKPQCEGSYSAYLKVELKLHVLFVGGVLELFHRITEWLRLAGTSGGHLVQTSCSSRDT